MGGIEVLAGHAVAEIKQDVAFRALNVVMAILLRDSTGVAYDGRRRGLKIRDTRRPIWKRYNTVI